MNLPDAPAQSDSQSRRRRPPPAQRLHSKCFTLPPCQTLHQAHKSSQRRRRRFHFPFFFCITVDEVKRPISGQRRKHTLDLARSGSRVGGEAGGLGGGDRGLEVGQHSETGWHFTRGDSQLCQKPASVQRPLTATDQRWFLADPAQRPPRAPRRVDAPCTCVQSVILSATQYKKKTGCNYLCCFQDPSACLFSFGSVSTLRLLPRPALIRRVSATLFAFLYFFFPCQVSPPP